MGSPTIWSVLFWIGASVFILFSAYAMSPFGKGLPQRGQGIAMLAVLGAILTGIGFMAEGPGEPTPHEVAAAERQRGVEDLRKLSGDVATFPASAAQTIGKLEELEVRDGSSMDSAAETLRLFEMAGRRVRMVEEATLAGRVNVPNETAEAKTRLKALLIRKQRELFPVMRQTYAAYMSQAVVGTQANFRAVGKDRKTLRVASPSFSSRDVVMDIHSELVVQATRFRFTKAEYVYSLTGASDDLAMHGDGDGDID